jgi:GNAT superfamily N-acetyltransferase
VIIRRATLSDLDIVTPLFDAYRQFYEQKPDLPGARTFLAERIGHNESVIFLALAPDGAGTGFTQLFPLFSSTVARRIWLLNDLFVTPGQRGTGIGQRLMEAARTHAVETGAAAIELATAVTNRTAQRLYESLGYRRDIEFYHYELKL